MKDRRFWPPMKETNENVVERERNIDIEKEREREMNENSERDSRRERQGELMNYRFFIYKKN